MFSSVSSSVEENSDIGENEQIDRLDDYDNFFIPEYYTSEILSVSGASIRPKWRKTPRSPADFSSSPSNVTCYRDSDYEDWLENYYRELYKEQTKQSFEEKNVDTSDLIDKKSDKILTSLFPSIKEGWSSYSTKYWGPKDVRRHWPLRIKRGKYSFLPSIHPLLNLRSRYGRFFSQLNSGAAIPEGAHIKFVCSIFKKILQGTVLLDPQLMKFMICDTLCNFKWFDFLSKKMVTRYLCRLLRTQYNMEKVYLENMDLDRKEGIILLCALSRNAGDEIKEIHMWKMFGYGQCPLLLNVLSQKGDFLPVTESTEYFTKIHYMEILNKFSSLTQLSINYAYLANQNGDALLSLKCLRFGSLEKLRVLCTMEERPLLTNPGYGVGGWKIGDGVWRRVTEWCPQLQVSFVFLNMAQYENIIVFLSKSIPVSHVYISSGIDFRFQVPWDIDSTLLELRNWYSSTLKNLCLHLWHHRDLLDFVISRKILEEFPNLLNFEFIGVLNSVETLEEFCCQLSKGTYKLKTLLFWVEEEYSKEKKLNLTRKRVSEIRQKYHKKFQIPPYVNYIIEDDAVILQGSFGQLWHTLEERLGFSSQYIIENYNTGVVNFQNGRRDVLLRPSVISSEDVDKFDFSFPIGSTWYELYLKDSDEINSSNSYIRNWSIGIWILTGAMIFLFTFLLCFMLHVAEKFSLRDMYIVSAFEHTFELVQYFSTDKNMFSLPKNWRKMKRDYWNLKNKNDKCFGNCFTVAISVFCSQDVHLGSTLLSIRLLMLFFLIFGMIMFNSYSALLVSQLTLGERFLPFDKLEEIPVKEPKYSLCVRPESYPYLYFTVNHSRRVLQKKWENIVNRQPCPENGMLSFEDMCQPYVAFLEAPAVMTEAILRNVHCKMTNLRGRYFNVQFSLMILKGFGENGKKELNLELARYREVGILSYLQGKWIRQQKLPLGIDDQRLQVTFEHIRGLLLVYVFCLIFSCCIFFLEIIFYFKTK